MTTVKKTTQKAKTEAGNPGDDIPVFRSREERPAAGHCLTPRSQSGVSTRKKDRDEDRFFIRGLVME